MAAIVQQMACSVFSQVGNINRDPGNRLESLLLFFRSAIYLVYRYRVYIVCVIMLRISNRSGDRDGRIHSIPTKHEQSFLWE